MDASHLTTPQMPAVSGAADQGGCGAVSRLATPDELLAAALWYAARGWPVFPVEAGGKRPVPVHGFKDAVSDADRIRAWWHGRPYNVAVATGAPGPDVLDVDQRPDGSGWAAFNRLKAAGLLSGAHRLVRTPSGGAHLYFRGTDQRCGSLKAERLDFKARGGYILLPPSQVGGRPYQLLDDRPPTGATLDWQAAKTLLCPPRVIPVHGPGPWRGGSVAHLPAWLAQQAEGNRNHALFWAACRAADAGNQDVLWELVHAAVHAGLDEAEARRTVESAARKVNDAG